MYRGVHLRRKAMVLVYTAVLSYPSLADAQTAPRLGIKGGITNSAFFLGGSSSGTGDLQAGGGSGFAIGIATQLPAGGKWKIQPEVLLVEKAATLLINFRVPPSVETLSPLRSGRIATRILYLQIPVVVRHDFGGANTRPFVFAHAVAGFKLSATTDRFGDALLGAIGFEGSLGDELNARQFAAGLGAGVDLGAASGPIWSAEVRLEWALNNAFKDPRGPTTGVLQSDEKLQSVMLLVAYWF